MHRSNLTTAILIFLTSLLIGCGKPHTGSSASQTKPASDNVVNLYIWSDYLPPNTLPTFEARTGIKVNVSYFDTLAVPETRLLTGHTNLDVVITSPPFFRGLIARGVFQPLDRRQLPNFTNISRALMAKIAEDDPDNVHGLIFTWGTYGITYDERKVAASLSNPALNSWSLIFDTPNAAKLAHCHINTLDSPAALVPIALSYLRRNPKNPTPRDLDDVADLLRGIRPFIHNIDTAGLIDAMANGDACAAFDSNGDAFLARRRAKEAKNGINIDFIIPNEGSLIWFDLLAIPTDAPHVANAHRLINYLLDPQVTAAVTNNTGFANANTAATLMLDPSIASDPMVYPPQDQLQRLYPLPEYTPEQTRAITRLWQNFKTGQ